jgi:hypothetical protein
MKLRVLMIFLLCILLAGCAAQSDTPAETTAPAPTEATASVPAEATQETAAQSTLVRPLPDTTMDALANSTVNVSLEEGAVYRDASGRICLRMQIYSYDKFDMVDISLLEAGSTILLSGEEIPVTSVERNDHGTVLINGGLDEGGFDLVTNEGGIYYVQGYSDMKSWYLVGEAEYPVREDFVFTDSADLELGTVSYTAEELLEGKPVAEFGYQPHNTIVRIENGETVAMERIYTP